jgi:predicted DNA-binding mobile mystery protein A
MESNRFLAIRRRQIDRALKNVNHLNGIEVPRRGWIAEIRATLGMRSAQLGRRLGLSQSAAAQFAHAEAEGTITLNSLRKVAEAMNCRLVYAFVPEKSFEDLLRDRAELVARASIAKLGHTMALEAQQPDNEVQQEMIKELAERLVRELSRQLWEPIDEVR